MAKNYTVQLNDEQRITVLAAMELQQKSFERAARQHEIMQKQAIAAAVRDELRKLIETKHLIETGQTSIK